MHRCLGRSNDSRPNKPSIHFKAHYRVHASNYSIAWKMNSSTFPLLLVVTIAALFFVNAEDIQKDTPPSGLRRAADSEFSRGRETWFEALQTPNITCPCSCSTPYGRRFVGSEQVSGEGVLIQIIPIPGSPPEHTQICLLQETATPAMNAFPYVAWW
jgi:hypothetical protein